MELLKKGIKTAKKVKDKAEEKAKQVYEDAMKEYDDEVPDASKEPDYFTTSIIKFLKEKFVFRGVKIATKHAEIVSKLKKALEEQYSITLRREKLAGAARADLTYENLLAIEIKGYKARDQVLKALGQALSFLKEFKHAIIYLWDKRDKRTIKGKKEILTQEEIDYYKDQNIHVIIDSLQKT